MYIYIYVHICTYPRGLRLSTFRALGRNSPESDASGSSAYHLRVGAIRRIVWQVAEWGPEGVFGLRVDSTKCLTSFFVDPSPRPNIPGEATAVPAVPV